MSYTHKTIPILRQRRQCGGGSVMIWGMVMSNGLVVTKVIEGHLNSEKYVELLKHFAVPCMNLNYKDYSFVQDNSPVHTAKIVKEFVRKSSLNVLEWPAKSPDINIMENVWKMLSDIVYSGDQPPNIAILKRRISLAVEKINTDKREVILSLYASIRRRLTTVLVSKGNIYKET